VLSAPESLRIGRRRLSPTDSQNRPKIFFKPLKYIYYAKKALDQFFMWKILIFSNLSRESRKEETLGKSIVRKTLECWDIVDIHCHKRYLEIQETYRYF